jgi:hypothetical protein
MRHSRNMPIVSKKRLRSLKVAVPPAAELAPARAGIINAFASFNPTRDKIQIVYSSEAERRRLEKIIDKITKQLCTNRRPEWSQVSVYNQVALACVSAEAGKDSTKSVDIEDITKRLVDAATKLHRALGSPALPPNYIFRVFRSTDKWNQFVEHLQRLAALNYTKPPRNFDPVKRDCAVLAHLLITQCTVETATSTQSGLFRTVASLLHQFACPTADGKLVDLKYACDRVLKRVKAGTNFEIEPW